MSPTPSRPPSSDDGSVSSRHSNNSGASQRTLVRRLYTPHPSWMGVKILPFVISIGIGLIIRFAVPKPHDLSKQAWQLLAIFLTTIAGLILSPLPVGAWSLFCLTLAIITKTLAFAAAFDAFKTEVIWLIVASFFFSRGFIKTGLGNRIAMWFVRLLGRTTLGLSYGLVLSEAAVAPAMPSVTARAGGIFLPIIKSLALGADSSPKDGTSRKIGAFLIQAQLQKPTSEHLAALKRIFHYVVGSLTHGIHIFAFAPMIFHSLFDGDVGFYDSYITIIYQS